jgi:hypothetical protein
MKQCTYFINVYTLKEIASYQMSSYTREGSGNRY